MKNGISYDIETVYQGVVVYRCVARQWPDGEETIGFATEPAYRNHLKASTRAELYALIDRHIVDGTLVLTGGGS